MREKPEWSKNLIKARKDKNLTQKQLASLSGLHELLIRKYECGDALPSYDSISKICEILDIDWERIFMYELSNNNNAIISKLFEKGVREINTIIAEKKGLEMRQMGYTGIWYVDNVYQLFLSNGDEILSSDLFPILEVLNYSLKTKKELHQEFKEKMLKFLMGKLKHKEKIDKHLVDALNDDKNFRKKNKNPSIVHKIIEIIRPQKKKPD